MRTILRSHHHVITTFTSFLINAIPMISALSNYPDCELSNFYSTLNGNLENRTSMHILLKSMHRDVVPYSSTASDVWDALIDLDGVIEPNGTKVHLIYRDLLFPALPYGTTTTWNREHLWPKNHGVGYTGPDFTDLHHLRPADWNVNAARSDEYFSACGVVNGVEECVTPGHAQAAADTESDSSTFLPPGNVRGDIARALMYMAVRYDGDDDPDFKDLELSDCPDADGADTHMGYLSQLLEWHMLDPVDAEEEERNDKVCRNWQGNRNPFVDYPFLAEVYFGLPQVYTPGVGYDCPGQATAAPTTAKDGTCNGLTAGDVMITGFRSDSPDTVVMVALRDIPAGVEIFLTDNAWTGFLFKSNEGVKKLVVPSTGIASGTIFGYGHDSLQYYQQWESVSGLFSLAADGDNIFVYCLSSDDSPVHLTGLLYNGQGWSDANSDETAFTTGASALPESLAGSSLSLPHFDNYVYSGATHSGSPQELINALSDPTQWTGSDDPEFDVTSSQTNFNLNAGPCKGVSAGDVMITGVRSDWADAVVMVALKEIPEGAEILLSDSAWTGYGFKSTEGVKKLVVPSGGIPAGNIFGFGDVPAAFSSMWENVSGSFILSTSGDNLHLFCLESDGITPVHITALLYTGTDWASPNPDESAFTSSTSALPSTLPSNCALALPHYDNFIYSGFRNGSRDGLLAELSSAVNWVGSNQPEFDIISSQTNFVIV